MSTYDSAWQRHLTGKGIPPPECFSLWMAGRWVCDLPPSLPLPQSVGLADPYSWIRAPGSSTWRPKGDGIQPKRPQLTLSGSWPYDSDVLALEDMARIEALLPSADQLFWCGRPLIGLLPGGISQPTLDATTNEVKHMLTLNLSTTLTAAMLLAARTAQVGA